MMIRKKEKKEKKEGGDGRRESGEMEVIKKEDGKGDRSRSQRRDGGEVVQEIKLMAMHNNSNRYQIMTMIF